MLGRQLHRVGDGVGGFDGGDDAFELAELVEGPDCLVVVGSGHLGAPGSEQVGVFGADSGVVEA